MINRVFSPVPGKPLMARLSEEVRSAAAQYGNGELTHEVIANLPLVDSVIYETLRTQPPIAVQVRGLKSHECQLFMSSFE